MKGVLSTLINFFSDKQYIGNINYAILLLTIIILLIALWICIIISKKNKLYINIKKDDKDNAFT